MQRDSPRWPVTVAWLAVLSALPTIVWRSLVGLGLALGTPAEWRAHEDIPGSGTTYVLALSALQLVAALLAPAMFHPRLCKVPGWLIAAPAVAGTALLGYVCLMSITHWQNVNPFAGQPITGWLVLCHVCYLAALVWPVALLGAAIGRSGIQDSRGAGGGHQRFE